VAARGGDDVKRNLGVLALWLAACSSGVDEQESIPSNLYAGQYMGCYSDTIPRALPYQAPFAGSIDPCLASCNAAGYRYAGLQWYGECFCGQDLANELRPDGECNTPCVDGSGAACGGAWRNSIYATQGGGGETARLNPGEYLWAGEWISANGGMFVYQVDGNLVLYQTSNGQPLWASGTAGTSQGITVMQGDGNLVVYDGGGVPVWASNTAGHPGAYADLVLGNPNPRLLIVDCASGSCTTLVSLP
jgi:hypothetical protein